MSAIRTNERDIRAGVEPLIGELKNGFGIHKASSADFCANEAAFLLKLLARPERNLG